MTLNFHAFQLAAWVLRHWPAGSWSKHLPHIVTAKVLLFSVFLVNSILNNGQSNWLEAMQQTFSRTCPKGPGTSRLDYNSFTVVRFFLLLAISR